MIVPMQQPQSHTMQQPQSHKSANPDDARVTFRVECGDSAKIMTTIPDRSIGAVISDPPFFIGIGRNDGGFGADPWTGTSVSSVAAATDWALPFAIEIERVLRPGGACVVMAGSQASAVWMNVMEVVNMAWMAEITILWNTGKPRRRNFGSLTTRVIWFAKPGARHTWNCDQQAIYSNVLVAKKPRQAEMIHPAQKPVEITNFLVSLLSKPGDVILDPFCGSGSTLVSAVLCGRDCIGIDMDRDNCKSAVRRIASAEVEHEDDIYLWVNNRLEEV